MHADDRPRGHVLTRRQALALLGAAGVSCLAPGIAGAAEGARRRRSGRGSSTGTCVVRPEQTEGPYFVDEVLERSDIRSDPFDDSIRPGTQLDLVLNVAQIAASICAPLAGAVVDVWQCDAAGVYSDVQDPRFDTRGRKFLRGYQVTDANGVARFTTIYPGWYPGRTVHIHFKVRSAPQANPGFEFTSQLYFDDDVTDTVFTAEPYASRGARSTRNPNDGIYQQGGAQLLLQPTPAQQGYTAAFDLALEIEVGVAPGAWGAIKASYRR